jgi:hypothetical protein
VNGPSRLNNMLDANKAAFLTARAGDRLVRHLTTLRSSRPMHSGHCVVLCSASVGKPRIGRARAGYSTTWYGRAAGAQPSRNPSAELA